MGSTSVIPSLSGESCTSKPKIPVILLDSDDEDVEIVEVRSVQEGRSHERATSSGSGTSGAGAHRESTSTSTPPSLKRELEQEDELEQAKGEEAKTKSPHQKRQRSEFEDDSHLIPYFFPITTSHFNYEEEPRTLGKLEKAAGVQGRRSEEYRQDDKAPSPYTKEYFIDLADTVASLFPVDSFAAQHGCSPAEVSRAVSALVVSPLMDPALYEKVSGGEYSSIEDYGRMMIRIWTDRYRKMVNDENGSEDNDSDSDSGSSCRALASTKGRSEQQEDVVKMATRHLVMYGVRQGMEGHEPRAGDESSASARHWVERDSFGIYVESESPAEESEGSLLFVEI